MCHYLNALSPGIWNLKMFPGGGASFPGRGFSRSNKGVVKIDLPLVFLLKKYYHGAWS
jgi:hypothetical protein